MPSIFASSSKTSSVSLSAVIDQTKADLIGNDLVVENPLSGLGDRDRFRQQVVHLDDVDAAVAHLLHKVEVIAFGVVHPQHIVKQQRVAIRRREALISTAGRTDHHLPQLADL